VAIFLESKHKTKLIDLMPNRQEEITQNTENDNLNSQENIDEDDFVNQKIQNIEQSITMTIQAICEKQKILYQPTFRF
jgi:exosome complex RNA-binding protein Rrp4